MRSSALAVIILIIALLACSSGKLSDSKAQAALNHWAISTRVDLTGAQAPMTWNDQPRSDLQVKGVHESPNDNSATADIQFNAFRYGRGSSDVFTGKGTATFSHYNDGRWVLTKIDFPGRQWNDLSVEP